MLKGEKYYFHAENVFGFKEWMLLLKLDETWHCVVFNVVYILFFFLLLCTV